MDNINIIHDRSPKVRVLSVMEKLLTELKLERGNKILLTILEKLLLNLNKEKNLSLREDLILTFLNGLQHNTNEDIDVLHQNLKQPFFSNALKKFITNDVNIEMRYQIGQGGFGTVFLGKLTTSKSEQTVAVKIPLSDGKNEILLDEATIMANLDHRNVVKILAFQKSPMRLIMEYLNWKNLECAVGEHDYTSSELLQSLHDISTGMEYLGMKKIVHNDLACRNIFVDSSKLCKIGDFGLARYYGNSSTEAYHEKTRLINMYNTAPEARITQIFSPKSDVWSFGILAYELYSGIDNPFPFGPMNIQMLDWCGYNLFQMTACPSLCPMEFFLYMDGQLLNWNYTERPDFTSIKQKIESILSSDELESTSSYSSLFDSDVSFIDSDY